MTEDQDELIVAFLDDALSEVERRAFIARLADDRALADRVASHRWLKRQIVAAFPMPRDHQREDRELAARLGLPPGAPDRWPVARLLRTKKAGMTYALAASLLIGLLIGRLDLSRENDWVAMESGKPAATGELARALSVQHSGEAGKVRITLSFRSSDGVCRSFHTSDRVSGLACRQADRWILEMLQRDREEGVQATSEFRLAGGGVSPAVMAEVDRRIVDEPLSKREEVDLISADWNEAKGTD